MYGNNNKRSRAAWARGIAALWAALIVAAGGGASAAPVKTVLHSFTGGDGATPFAGLIADSSGNLYGTTANGGGGGSGCIPGQGCGVVFKLSPGGTETVLHFFTGGSDGWGPAAGLIGSGNLYGTTANGGASGNGTVFKLAGTGFVPAIPFLAFNAKLAIQFGSIPTKDAFGLGSNITLSSTAPGINPLTDPVTLQAGTFTTTIPPGSFIKHADGSFTFQGLILGVGLGALIKPTGTLRYAFQAKATGANLTGIVNPVPVTLTIGGNTGTAN